MGNITGGVTVSADGKCRDFAFGVLWAKGFVGIRLDSLTILNHVSSFASIFSYTQCGPAVVTLRQQTPFKLISRFHPIIQNAMNVV